MNKTLISITSFIIGAVLIGVLIAKDRDERVSGTVETDFLTQNFTARSRVVSTTRQLVLSEKSDRQYAKLCNIGVFNGATTTPADPTLLAWLYFTNASTSVVAASSTPLNPRGLADNCFVIGEVFKYPGEVWAISNSTSGLTISSVEQ